MTSTTHDRPDGVRRQVRWGALAGTLVFVYTAFLAVQIAAVGFDNNRLYTRLHQLEGNVVSRAVLAVVLVAALFHGLNGLRVTLVGMSARLARHDRGLHTAVQFLTFAVGVPGAFVILWPSIWELFA